MKCSSCKSPPVAVPMAYEEGEPTKVQLVCPKGHRSFRQILEIDYLIPAPAEAKAERVLVLGPEGESW